MTSPAARRRSQFIDAVIDDYAAAHSTPPDAHQLELQRVTQEKTGRAAGMQIGDDQAVLMEMLVRAMGAKRAVEIGTFTGYSALAVARGLGPGGRLLCCDVSQEWTSIAREAWQEAGVASRIELRVGPGLETLRALPPGEQFDFAFIDADKTGYARYYEEILTRMRPGGLMLLDNTLQGGHVASDLAGDEDVAAIRSLNDAIAADPRVKVVLLPIGTASASCRNSATGSELAAEVCGDCRVDDKDSGLLARAGPGQALAAARSMASSARSITWWPSSRSPSSMQVRSSAAVRWSCSRAADRRRRSASAP